MDDLYNEEMEDDFKEQMSEIETLLQGKLDDHTKEMCQLWTKKLKNCEKNEYFTRNQYLLLLGCFLKVPKSDWKLPFTNPPPKGALQPLNSESDFSLKEFFKDKATDLFDETLLEQLPNSEDENLSDEKINLDEINPTEKNLNDIISEDEGILDESINNKSGNLTRELNYLLSNSLSDEGDSITKDHFDENFLNEENIMFNKEKIFLEDEHEMFKNNEKQKSNMFYIGGENSSTENTVSSTSKNTKSKRKKSFLSKFACIPTKSTLLEEEMINSESTYTENLIFNENINDIVGELSNFSFTKYKVKEFLEMQLKFLKQIQLENEEKIIMLRDLLSEIKSKPIIGKSNEGN